MNRTIRSTVKDTKLDFPCRSYKGLVGDPGSMQKKRSRTPDVLKVTQNNKISITTTVYHHQHCVHYQDYQKLHHHTIRALANASTVQVKAIPFLWPVITIGEYIYTFY